MAMDPDQNAKGKFTDSELTSLAIEIINDAGWLKHNPHLLDSSDEFISRLAEDIQRELRLQLHMNMNSNHNAPAIKPMVSSKSASTHTSYLTSSSAISSSYTEPSKTASISSRDHLFFLSCPEIKPVQSSNRSRSHPRFESRDNRMYKHKSAQAAQQHLRPKYDSPIIKYPNQRARAIKHVIALPKDKRKPVLCSPLYAAQYQMKWKTPEACLSSRAVTPTQKACAVPDFFEMNDFDLNANDDPQFGDIVTKGAPQNYRKHKKSHKKRDKKRRKKKIKHVIVEKQCVQSKLRSYKKRDKNETSDKDKCEIKINAERVKDHEYSFVSSPSSNDSMYNNEGVEMQTNNTNAAANDEVINKAAEGQHCVEIQTGFESNI